MLAGCTPVIVWHSAAMISRFAPHLGPALADALQCAVTLVLLLAAVGLIAWAAGLATLADLPWVLSGVFGGSFAMAVVKGLRR